MCVYIYNLNICFSTFSAHKNQGSEKCKLSVTNLQGAPPCPGAWVGCLRTFWAKSGWRNGTWALKMELRWDEVGRNGMNIACFRSLMCSSHCNLSVGQQTFNRVKTKTRQRLISNVRIRDPGLCCAFTNSQQISVLHAVGGIQSVIGEHTDMPHPYCWYGSGNQLAKCWNIPTYHILR